MHRAGINAISGARGRGRTVLDIVVDGRKSDLVTWLRALGAEEGGGASSESLLAAWKARGWQGSSTGTRWWSSSWGSQDRWEAGRWDASRWGSSSWSATPSWGKASGKGTGGNAGSSNDAPRRR